MRAAVGRRNTRRGPTLNAIKALNCLCAATIFPSRSSPSHCDPDRPGRRSQGAGRYSIVPTAILVATLLFVVQSRQLILASLVATAFVLRNSRAVILFLAMVVSFYLAICSCPAWGR